MHTFVGIGDAVQVCNRTQQEEDNKSCKIARKIALNHRRIYRVEQLTVGERWESHGEPQITQNPPVKCRYESVMIMMLRCLVTLLLCQSSYTHITPHHCVSHFYKAAFMQVYIQITRGNLTGRQKRSFTREWTGLAQTQ